MRLINSNSFMTGLARTMPLLFLILIYLPSALTAGTLPQWVQPNQDLNKVLVLDVPSNLKAIPDAKSDLAYLVLRLDPTWSPQWKNAAFELKNLIVTVKTAGPAVRVGLDGTQDQINQLLNHELAAYVDGYLFDEEPFVPDGDETGKMWQKAKVSSAAVLTTLVDAASLGIELVLFDGNPIDEAHRNFLNAINETQTGSLDLQPKVEGMPAQQTIFFFEPASGNYHLAVYGNQGDAVLFSLGKGLKVSALYPSDADYEHLQYGRRTEIRLGKGKGFTFFLLEPGEKAGTSESLEIVERKTIDPYELVVKNQVFKDSQQQKFQSLMVDELQNYRYQAPSGPAVDVSFDDTLIIRKDQPIERLRRDFYLGNVKWRRKKLPNLPLIQPEKVQTAPLVVDLNKSYDYSYQGEDKIDGHQVWKVRFQPKTAGDYFSGTVWIDQQSGAHRKLSAIQSGLEPPVIGNEIIAYFDWVEDGGVRYWTQVREDALQILSVAGLRLSLQINSVRSNYRFNREDTKTKLAEAYDSDMVILRDTDQGFRYMERKGDKRVMVENTMTKPRAILGGVFIDPARDSSVVPLAGFNYTNLDFLKRGWQANFFVAGAVNDIIVTNPDFMDKGWDLTGELFLSAIKFSDRTFENGEENLEQEVETLRESFNLTLAIPLNSFFRFSANYGLRYLDFGAGDDTLEEYVIPVSTLEHIGRLNLEYSRRRFTSELEYEFVTRSDWEQFGLPDSPEPLEDSFSSLRLDLGISKRLPKFQTLIADLRLLKGWNQDRFSRFGFGFFENRVSGFGSSGAEGNQAVRLRLGYDLGIGGLFKLHLQLDGARAWLDENDPNYNPAMETVDLIGFDFGGNVMGPWGTLIRVDLGYGISSDLEGEDGEISGQIVFLKLF